MTAKKDGGTIDVDHHGRPFDEDLEVAILPSAGLRPLFLADPVAIGRLVYSQLCRDRCLCLTDTVKMVHY